MKNIDYNIIYSKRKTIGIIIDDSGNVIIRSPKRVPLKMIEELVTEKTEWIERAKERIRIKNNICKVKISDEEKQKLVERAKLILPEKINKYSSIMGVKPSKVRITNAKSYWGCCNAKNVINFSWRLMVASEKTINYVVVHELAHINEKNHGKKFWSEVERIVYEINECKAELKKIQNEYEF